MLVPLGYRRLHQSRRKQCTMHARNALFRAGFNTAQWCKARINGGAQNSWENQLLLSRSASTTVSIPAEATKAGEGRGSFNTKRLTIYSGAALVAVSSVAAVSAHQRTFKQDLHSSHLLDSPWVQAIPQQQDVLQVLSAESISTHPLLSHDHLVSTRPSAAAACNCDDAVVLTQMTQLSFCSSRRCCKLDSSQIWCASMTQRHTSIILSFSLASKCKKCCQCSIK